MQTDMLHLTKANQIGYLFSNSMISFLPCFVIIPVSTYLF